MKITVEHLSYTAGKKQILRDVNTVFEGQKIYGIIGPNGSGKTTLLRHLYRQIPSRGSIFMDGTDISGIAAKVYARKAAVMMQHQDLFESELRVRDVIRTGRYPYKSFLSHYNSRDEEIITEIMRRNALLEYENRQLCTLSGGELQRVMLCRAMAQQPEVIILDEPTNHLDIRYKLELMETLRQFDGLVIMTLHDLNLAASYCSELYVLQDGSVAAHGIPEEICSPELLGNIFQAEIPVFKDEEKILIGI